jgi:hypothetical protein
MNAYERSQRATASRVAKGKTRLVRAQNVQTGMVGYDHGQQLSHYEPSTDPSFAGKVCFANGSGFAERPDSMVEVWA